MASASAPCAVSLIQSASWVCIDSEFVESAGVEDARGIERRLEAAMDLHEGGLARMEHTHGFVPAPKERRMSARSFGRRAHRERIGAAAKPAQPPAPLDQLRAAEI